MPHLSQLGLFGSKLSENSIANMKKENPDNDFQFIDERPKSGWVYDYGNDFHYKELYTQASKIVNPINYIEFLNRNRLVLLPHFLYNKPIKGEFVWIAEEPKMAIEPPRSWVAVSYVWPSFVIWDNDPSFISFLGIPDKLELPKHVLRETRGHPQYSDDPRHHLRLRLPLTEWSA